MQKSQFTSQSETEDKKMSEKYVFGIDLGTTYSCISYFDENMQCTPCPSMEGPTTTPSVVRLEPDSEPVVGQSAKNTAVIYPDTTIQFVSVRTLPSITVPMRNTPRPLSQFLPRYSKSLQTMLRTTQTPMLRELL